MAAAMKKALAAKETSGQERVAASVAAVGVARSFPSQGTGVSLSGAATTVGSGGESEGEGERGGTDPSVSDSAREGLSDEVSSLGRGGGGSGNNASA
eukprot:4775750-Pleurochrysis_carterae.AAC.2